MTKKYTKHNFHRNIMLIAICALLFVCTLNACSKKNNIQPSVSCSTLQTAILSAGFNLPSMNCHSSIVENEESETYFNDTFGYDYKKINQYFVYESYDEARPQYFIVLAELKQSEYAQDETQVNALYNAVVSYKESLLSNEHAKSQAFEDAYEKSKIYQNGRYVVFLMTDNNDEIYASFEKCLEKAAK